MSDRKGEHYEQDPMGADRVVTKIASPDFKAGYEWANRWGWRERCLKAEAALRWIADHHQKNRLHPNIAEILADKAERTLANHDG